VVRLFARAPLPALDAFDLLILLGGPMSGRDEAHFDWLRPEKRFIRHSIERGKQVLGICLGAQLIADAMGARIVSGREREIGWFPVHQHAGSSGHASLGRLPKHFTALHWHRESFTLPTDARVLAYSEGCEHQAFSLGNSVLGLQFHLESTRESVEALVQNCPGDLVHGRFVQAPHAMLSAQDQFITSNHLLAQLLDGFTAGLRPTA
jgi:GMP synthase (glutamine-hydrolysing)